jgi:NAD-dependent deacetylase sirtuin 4
VPKAAKADFTAEVAALRTFVGARKNLVAITGAGLSTESGLPDYRSPNGSYSKGHKPTTIQEFGASERSRIRFWARSFEGWMTFSNASPNRGHLALAALESNGPLRTIITQNVDGLHQKAGSKSVIELHGSLHQVKCMDCGSFHDRIQFQTHLAQLNPEWYRGLLERHQKREQLGTLARADGDVALELDFEKFKVPACYTCGGRLQPGVVMFGDNVPPAVTQSARAAVEVADGILVAGTSLQVFSAYKWILQARERKIPVVIINIGPTRGDSEAELKIEHRLGDILPQIFRNESQL